MKAPNIFANVKKGEEGFKMKLYIYDGYGFFYDVYRREWTLYPVNAEGERIEDGEDVHTESRNFRNKTELKNWMLKQ